MNGLNGMQIWFAAIVVAAVVALMECKRANSVVAYFPNGERIEYFADARAQVVRSIEFSATGVDMATDHSCTVINTQNWVCPAVTNMDGTADWRWGGTRAVSGRVESTDPKEVIPPMSWLSWELEKVHKLL